MILYAAYGSNLHPIRLTERIPSTRLLGTSFVPGWSLQFHKRSKDGSGKCNLLRPGDGVHIAVYAMRKMGKQELDEIEGLGKGYEDASIDVPGFGRCSTYLGSTSHICNDLAPFDWYKEMVLLGCRKLAFPDGYVSMIEVVTASRDPHEKRRHRQWQLVERLRHDI